MMEVVEVHILRCDLLTQCGQERVWLTLNHNDEIMYFSESTQFVHHHVEPLKVKSRA